MTGQPVARESALTTLGPTGRLDRAPPCHQKAPRAGGRQHSHQVGRRAQLLGGPHAVPGTAVSTAIERRAWLGVGPEHGVGRLEHGIGRPQQGFPEGQVDVHGPGPVSAAARLGHRAGSQRAPGPRGSQFGHPRGR